MILTYQYGLRPRRKQHVALDGILEGQRLFANAALQERRDAWRLARKSVSYVGQTASLTQIRADDPDGYGSLPANLSRWTLKRIDDSFQSFFERCRKNGKAGFPRFKSIARWRSFGFAEFSGIRLVNGALVFEGMPGRLKLHMHRPLPPGATILSCVFTKEAGRWRVSLQIDAPDVHTVRREISHLVGLDWGVENHLSLSTGEAVENPRLGKAAAAADRRASRKLNRAEKGSKRRKKTRAELARVRKKLANRRKTHLHQASARIARVFGSIAVEDLNVKSLTASAKGTVENPGKNVRQKAGLNREILDTSPGRLIEMIRYKAERAGGNFVEVDAKQTSQDCSGCGATVRKDLKTRIHRCAHCKTELHRDVNAARNILKRAVVGPWSGFARLPTFPQEDVAPEPLHLEAAE